MNLSLYLDSGTWVHLLDGRTKVVCLLMLFVLALIFSDPSYLLGLTVLVLFLIIRARALANLRKVWILLVLLFVYSTVLWPFFVQGQTIVAVLGNFVITMEGVAHGVGMGLRLDVFLMSGILLLSTTAIEDFAQALHQLGLPRSVGFALSLAFRWVPTLLGSVTTIVQAQRARGLDLASATILGKIRRYPPLVVPLIGHTLRQTNLLAMALESKGVGPGRGHRRAVGTKMHWRDYVTLMGMGVVLAFGIWLRMNGYGTLPSVG